MRTDFYYSYPNAICDIAEIDVDALRGECYGGDHLPTDEVILAYPYMEKAIRDNCGKLAKELARITHHTEEEWHDTIVVALMVQLLPGFADADEEDE